MCFNWIDHYLTNFLPDFTCPSPTNILKYNGNENLISEGQQHFNNANISFLLLVNLRSYFYLKKKKKANKINITVASNKTIKETIGLMSNLFYCITCWRQTFFVVNACCHHIDWSTTLESIFYNSWSALSCFAHLLVLPRKTSLILK